MRAARALAVGAAMAAAIGTFATAAEAHEGGHDTPVAGRPTGQDRWELATALVGTARYHRFSRAEDDGYGVLADAAGLTCIEDPGGAGGMGTHFVDGALVGDGEVDAAHPEALMYDLRGPTPRLIGVEYVVLAADWDGAEPPELFGQEFALVDAGNRYGLPPFYELHAWLWLHNPSGLHDDWNPRVGC